MAGNSQLLDERTARAGGRSRDEDRGHVSPSRWIP
jgi:hypothetical protein